MHLTRADWVPLAGSRYSWGDVVVWFQKKNANSQNSGNFGLFAGRISAGNGAVVRAKFACIWQVDAARWVAGVLAAQFTMKFSAIRLIN